MAAILLPAAHLLSVLSPSAADPDGLISLAYLGATVLIFGFVVLAISLWRTNPEHDRHRNDRKHV